MDPRFHLDFRSALFGLEFPFHQAGHVEVSGNGGDKILFQANGLGRIVIEGVETVREAEDIQYGSGLVRAGIRLQNNSFPRMNRASHFRKKERAVRRNQDKLVVIVALGDADFRRRVSQTFIHPVVSRDFLRRGE